LIYVILAPNLKKEDGMTRKKLALDRLATAHARSFLKKYGRASFGDLLTYLAGATDVRTCHIDYLKTIEEFENHPEFKMTYDRDTYSWFAEVVWAT
jgi:hypothetical protein